jgi:hypothetical protein
MSVRTLEQFHDALAEDLAWRRKELQLLKTDVVTAPQILLNTRLRVAIALLYAHWEGFIRSAVCLYVEYVSSKKLRYDELSAEILGVSLKSKIDAIVEAAAPAIHTEFARFLIGDLGNEARFARAAYEPAGIMSSTALANITTRFGIPYAPYELKEQLIDSTMCETRHKVAHGEDVLIQPGQYYSLQAEVVTMINDFANSLLDMAVVGAFRRPATA